MNFLGMGTLEILIILLVAFIFLGPERMVDAARMLGRLTREVRRMTADVRAEVSDLVKEEDETPARRPYVHREGRPGSRATSTTPQAPSQEQSTEASDAEDGPVAYRRSAPTAESDQAPPPPPQSHEKEDSS